MKITKSEIKQAILEALNEQEAPSPAMANKQKLTTQSQGSSAFAKAGKDTRGEANPELSNLERGIVKQIDEFLLNLAQQPGVELQTHKAIIQRVMNVLQKGVLPQQPVTTNEGCGTAMPPSEPLPQMAHDHDDEGRMAKSQLYRAAEYASELEQMIQDGDELDAWVQAKITKASDYLSSVKHYLYYKNARGDQ